MCKNSLPGHLHKTSGDKFVDNFLNYVYLIWTFLDNCCKGPTYARIKNKSKKSIISAI